MAMAAGLPLAGARAFAAAERAALLAFLGSAKIERPPTLRLTFLPAAARRARLAARNALRAGSMALERRLGFALLFVKKGAMKFLGAAKT